MAGHQEPIIYSPEFANYILPANGTHAIYYSEQPSIIPGMPDKVLSLIAPVAAYWALSLAFHALDTLGSDWKWLEKYRIHESAEVTSKNLVSKWDCVKAVIAQQVIQTALGYAMLDDHDAANTDHTAKMAKMSPIIVQSSLLWLGNPWVAQARLEAYGAHIIHFIYWWFIPAVQIFFAFFVIDTWQYFWHRYLHTNKFLYRHFHSWHHRLYVPYAFGALYNHPLEGLVLDSAGALFAEYVAGLSVRQAALLFAFASLKTVDDHCGYKIPFDPLQFFFSNNADYHDIHHQAIGIKKNFAQPFFVRWDTLLGTRMDRKEMEEKLKKARSNSVKHVNGNGVHHANGNGVHLVDSDKKKVE